MELRRIEHRSSGRLQLRRVPLSMQALQRSVPSRKQQAVAVRHVQIQQPANRYVYNNLPTGMCSADKEHFETSSLIKPLFRLQHELNNTTQ